MPTRAELKKKEQLKKAARRERGFAIAEASACSKAQDPRMQAITMINTFLSKPQEFECVPKELVKRTEKLVQSMLLIRQSGVAAEDPWMTDDPIYTYPAAVLRERALQPTIGQANWGPCATDLLNATQKIDSFGSGVAANQIGCTLPMIAVKLPSTGWVLLFNPELEIPADSGMVDSYEGCLSFPWLYGRVERPDHVILSGYTSFAAKGKQVFDLRGWDARLACHEIDHLYGILFVDRCSPGSLYWNYLQ